MTREKRQPQTQIFFQLRDRLQGIWQYGPFRMRPGCCQSCIAARWQCDVWRGVEDQSRRSSNVSRRGPSGAAYADAQSRENFSNCTQTVGSFLVNASCGDPGCKEQRRLRALAGLYLLIEVSQWTRCCLWDVIDLHSFVSQKLALSSDKVAKRGRRGRRGSVGVLVDSGSILNSRPQPKYEAIKNTSYST
ncbi:hypothetical protein M0657_011458 [Pyricularia oryzae]|nr:hypothetical protein M0657_011458 [Pyricularia oryzae]KAI7913506.1 hypothetical protein M9X92_009416 [Pyricularia oryzae]